MSLEDYYSAHHSSWFTRYRNKLSTREANDYYPIFYIFANRRDIAPIHAFYMYETVYGTTDVYDIIGPVVNVLTRPVIENTSRVYDQLKQHYGRYMTTKFTTFEPDFDIERSNPFPVTGNHPPRWISWYEMCRDMYEAGSVLFETLLDDGISWLRIVRVIHYFAVIVYDVCKKSVLVGRRTLFPTEQESEKDSYKCILHLHEYGFLVLKLLVKLYVQGWIDREGGWSQFCMGPERWVVSAQNLCVHTLVSQDVLLRLSLSPADLPKAWQQKLSKRQLLRVLLELPLENSDSKCIMYDPFTNRELDKNKVCAVCFEYLYTSTMREHYESEHQIRCGAQRQVLIKMKGCKNWIMMKCVLCDNEVHPNVYQDHFINNHEHTFMPDCWCPGSCPWRADYKLFRNNDNDLGCFIVT